MGSAHSSDRLRVPLQAQSTPLVAMENGFVAENLTVLRIDVPLIQRNSIRISDVGSDQLMFLFNTGSFTTRRTLATPSGTALASIKGGLFSHTTHVYDGGRTDKESFSVRLELSVFSSAVAFAEFYDRLTGDMCRVIIDGKSNDRVVVAYLERSRGQTKLPPLDKHADRSSKRFQAIGRIRGTGNSWNHPHEFFIEVAPGVDITLMLLLWHARFDVQRRRRQPQSD